MIVNTILPIFFLYFVLLSGYCSELLNCKLQKLMDRLVIFRHFLIFAGIYIFTFVLNWYTFASLQISHIDNKEKEDETSDNKKEEITKEFNIKMLFKWFFQSLIIYIIFLITTKTEIFQFMIFFALIVICIIFQLILKSITSKEYSNVNNLLFINENDYDGENKQNAIDLHNITSVVYLISIIIIIQGFYKYYIRQRHDHRKNWSFIKFIFGTSRKGKECANN